MDTNETTIYLAVIITVIVISIIIGYFAISIIRQQKRNLELQKLNALTEIASMEKERARIATDLHDDLGPVLSVVKFRINHAVDNGADAKDELEKASSQLDDLIARMREVANNLMPSALLRKGINGAIEEFATSTATASGVAIDFIADPELVLTGTQSINVYRIVQELIHNGIKHAKSNLIEIKVSTKDKVVTIFYRDNGIGFDYEQIMEEGTGFGLKSLTSRTSIMGGSLRIESAPQKGTAYSIDIPLT